MSCRRTILLLALLPLTLAQTAPATRPAVAIDLTTPAAALASYFRAQQALDLDALRKTFDVSDPQQAPYVERLINFRLWRHYLERQAIRRFGMGAVQRIAPLKDRLMAEARGESGDLPLLLRGLSI